MNKTVLDLIKNMPYEVYGNKYYKDKQYHNKRDYYRWDYDTKFKYYNYLIKLSDSNNYNNTIYIYLYRADKVSPVKRGPKVIMNTLQNIIAYFRIMGFKVETYD